MLGLADNTLAASLAARLRRQRMLTMQERLGLSEDHTVLDVGGSAQLWELVGWRGRVDILNLAVPGERGSEERFRYIVGDGCRLDLPDKSYDIVFSNSVIEHTGGPRRAIQFALEIRRVGRGYWVQAPCREFPVEPHFVFPGAQWLPWRVNRWLLRYWPYGWYRAGRGILDEVAEDARRLWLPRRRDMRALFPDGQEYVERWACLPKSVSMYRRIPRPEERQIDA